MRKIGRDHEMIDSPLRGAKRGAGSDQDAGGGVGELLDDFSSLLDTECRLIAAVIMVAVSTSYGIGCILVIALSPSPVSIWWKVTLGVCITVLLATTIYLIEPRPSHWLPTVGQIEHLFWSASISEQWLRVKRWWRWRKKYASRTKLNV